MTRKLFPSSSEPTPHSKPNVENPSSFNRPPKSHRKPKASFFDRLSGKPNIPLPTPYVYDSDEFTNPSSSVEHLPETVVQHTKSHSPSHLLRVAPTEPVLRVTLQPTRPLNIVKRSASPPSHSNQHQHYVGHYGATTMHKSHIRGQSVQNFSRPLPPLPNTTISNGQDDVHRKGHPTWHSQPNVMHIQARTEPDAGSSICECRVCVRHRSLTSEEST